MPIVAVAAIAAGAAVATGAVAATTVGLIGLGTTIVGKVTKSKELLQLGSGMSLGAGIASVATSVFGTAEAAATTAGTAVEGAAPTTAGGIDAAAGTTEGATSALGDAASSSVTTGLEGAGPVGAGGATSGLGGDASGGLLNATPQASQPLGSVPQASAGPGGVLGQSVANATQGASVPIVPPPATDSSSIVSWFSRQPESVKNKILQVGGQAAGGLFEGWSAEQKLALERERLKLLQQQQANGSAQPRVSFQNYNPPQYGGGGLLNATKG